MATSSDEIEAKQILEQNGLITTPDTATRTEKSPDGKRLRVLHNGRIVYEWAQTLNEVTIWIPLPSGIKKKDLQIQIGVNNLSVGIQNCPPYLNEATGGNVVRDESYWMLEDGELVITLDKGLKGDLWESALRGAGSNQANIGMMDDFTKEEVRKQLLLERFQQENPGFDFSGAEVNGAVPDARTFMGGIRR